MTDSNGAFSSTSQSLESDRNVEFATRYDLYYDCDKGHSLIIPFSERAQIPPFWECFCGHRAYLRDTNTKETLEGKVPKTAWDMLLERRTKKELEANFKLMLAEIRKGGLKRIRH